MATTTTPKTTTRKKATPKAAPKLSWAKRNPELVATIPAAIKAGQHPRAFATEHGISLSVAWAAFERAGWQASGNGGGKAISLTPAELRQAT